MSYFFHGSIVNEGTKIINESGEGVLLQANSNAVSSYSLIFPEAIGSTGQVLQLSSIDGTIANLEFVSDYGTTGDTGPTGAASTETGPTGYTGSSGATGATGPVSYYIFDGGDPDTNYIEGPAFDCGGVETGTVNIQLQLRRGNASVWTSSNPILANGEIGLELDNGLFKIGNGVTGWNNLEYGGFTGPTGSTGATGNSPPYLFAEMVSSTQQILYGNSTGIIEFDTVANDDFVSTSPYPGDSSITVPANGVYRTEWYFNYNSNVSGMMMTEAKFNLIYCVNGSNVKIFPDNSIARTVANSYETNLTAGDKIQLKYWGLTATDTTSNVSSLLQPKFRVSQLSNNYSTFQSLTGPSGPTGSLGPTGTAGPTGFTGPAAIITTINYVQSNSTSRLIAASTSAPIEISNVTITTSGYPVEIMCSCDFNPLSNASWIQLRLFRDTTAIGQTIQAEPGPNAGSNGNIPFLLHFIDNPSSGTYTYYAKIISVSYGSPIANINIGEAGGPIMTAVELNSARGPTGATGTFDSTSPISTSSNIWANTVNATGLYANILGPTGGSSSITVNGNLVSSNNINVNNINATGLYVSTIGATGSTDTINLTSNISSTNGSNITTTGYMAGNKSMQTFMVSNSYTISATTTNYVRVGINNNVSFPITSSLSQGTNYVTLTNNVFTFSQSGTYLINLTLHAYTASSNSQFNCVILKNGGSDTISRTQIENSASTIVGSGVNGGLLSTVGGRVNLSQSVVMPILYTDNVAVYVHPNVGGTINDLSRSTIQFIML